MHRTMLAILVALAASLARGRGLNIRGVNAAEDIHAAADSYLVENRPHKDTQQDLGMPTVFAAIPSRRPNATHRSALRKMWRYNVDLAGSSSDGGPRLVYRFMLCNASDGLADAIRAEYDEHRDLMLLDCEEGTAHGRLAIKTLHMLMAYWKLASNYDMFMKVEDSTFVDWKELERVLISEAAVSSTSNLYAGVPFEASTPCREIDFATYEPFFAFAGSKYPNGMEGGTGYLLGRSLVQSIMEEDMAPKSLLWNEDRAVAVWVDYVRSHTGKPIRLVEVPGGSSRTSSNYPADAKDLAWHTNKWILHHGLSGESIECLTTAAQSDNGKGTCFDLNQSAKRDVMCVNHPAKVETEHGMIEVP